MKTCFFCVQGIAYIQLKNMYQDIGVVTNLLAGLMGARWGNKAALLTGAAG
jgi:hypothetical protein